MFSRPVSESQLSSFSSGSCSGSVVLLVSLESCSSLEREERSQEVDRLDPLVFKTCGSRSPDRSFGPDSSDDWDVDRSVESLSDEQELSKMLKKSAYLLASNSLISCRSSSMSGG